MTTARQIGIVLCRVGAAFLTVQAIRSLGYTLPGLFYSPGGINAQVLAIALLTAVPGLAAIGLWVFAERISTIAEPQGTSDEAQPVTGIDLVRIGTALLGMYLVVTAITYGITMEVGYLLQPDSGLDPQSMKDEMAAQVIGNRISNLAKLAIGIALILGRDRIAVLFARAKYAGVDTATASEKKE